MSSLSDQIHKEAQDAFTNNFENIEGVTSGESPNKYYAASRQLFQRVQQTREWQTFKAEMVQAYDAEISQNILNNLQGLKPLIKNASDEL